MPADLIDQLSLSCFVFRGYNITNLGRTPELLSHPAYGPTVTRIFAEVSAVASEEAEKTIDLVDRVREQRETSLDSFPDAVALILGTEVAQVELLSEFFGIEYSGAKLAAGYSLGEVAAVACGGVMSLADAVRLPVALANDCADLGQHTRMGVLFSRGGVLSVDDVKRLCVEINLEGNGVIAISAYLSPNTILLLGQQQTIDRFDSLRRERLPKQVHLRMNDNRWPPLHTPIVRQRFVSNRASTRMQTMGKQVSVPQPPIVSLTTGTMRYNDYNSREVLNDWVDHPQHVWKAICETLAMGIKTVVHVGPEPNLFPSTYKRLADNIRAQLQGASASSLGKRIVSGIVHRPWLAALLPSQAALLRAPALEHIILEDWLLDQPVP